MIIFLICLTIYILSALALWNYFRIAHNEGGIYENKDIGASYVFLIFIPGLNTILSLSGWIDMPPRKSKKPGKWVNIFFGIKPKK